VFTILHGSPGEDGKLAGYFDLLGIPYTTCDQLTSAITMNKGYTKAIVQTIPELQVARSMQLFEKEPTAATRIQEELQLPLFIKPNNGGSSLGMSKVKTWEELPEALDKALPYCLQRRLSAVGSFLITKPSTYPEYVRRSRQVA
jgi:D-alanine-D-alanine ligase